MSPFSFVCCSLWLITNCLLSGKLQCQSFLKTEPSRTPGGCVLCALRPHKTADKTFMKPVNKRGGDTCDWTGCWDAAVRILCGADGGYYRATIALENVLFNRQVNWRVNIQALNVGIEESLPSDLGFIGMALLRLPLVLLCSLKIKGSRCQYRPLTSIPT